jgi:hypothetical protein
MRPERCSSSSAATLIAGAKRTPAFVDSLAASEQAHGERARHGVLFFAQDRPVATFI